jgi:CheY-like chemotaxis protein
MLAKPRNYDRFKPFGALALVRNFVTLHGGTVSAHSGGVDQGSEFIVRLPLVAAPSAESLRVRPKLRKREAGAAGKVLLVDDNEDAAEVLGEGLRMYGYEVTVAHDGPQALAALEQMVPKIVILDIGLPAMDGYEVARRIRAQKELESTRLLALTGYGQAGDRERALRAGFHEHFAKPVDLDDLLQAMESPA